MTPPPYIPFQQLGSSLWFYADHKGKRSVGYHSSSKCKTDADTAKRLHDRTDASTLAEALLKKADQAFDATGWPEHSRGHFVTGFLTGDLREALAATPKAHREALAKRLEAQASKPALAGT